MKDLKIVFLIDADNTQMYKLDGVLQKVSTYGRIIVKRAYGNWKKDTLKNWESELKRLAIKAEQQFDYVLGKRQRLYAFSNLPPGIRGICYWGRGEENS